MITASAATIGSIAVEIGTLAVKLNCAEADWFTYA
jgi:hypothetical protein